MGRGQRPFQCCQGHVSPETVTAPSRSPSQSTQSKNLNTKVRVELLGIFLSFGDGILTGIQQVLNKSLWKG